MSKPQCENFVTREDFSANVFRSLMRHVPSAVAIIAAGPPGKRNGLTVTSVCSLSAAPPTLLVCVNHLATAHDDIIMNGYFSINFLEANQMRVARVFSGSTGEIGEKRFKPKDWSIGLMGTPTLKKALCTLECRLSEQQKTSTHTIFFGEIIAGSVGDDKSPLVYVQNSYTALTKDLEAVGERQ